MNINRKFFLNRKGKGLAHRPKIIRYSVVAREDEQNREGANYAQLSLNEGKTKVVETVATWYLIDPKYFYASFLISPYKIEDR